MNNKDSWVEAQSLLTSRRRSRLEDVSARRFRHVRLVLQDIHHPHNVSACLRSAEAFGIYEIFVVNLHEHFKPSSVTRGVENWLKISKFSSIETAAAQLQCDGFQIAAAFPDQDSNPIGKLPLDKPLALLFGNEHDGIDPDWSPHISHRFTIPMAGLVESLNISVSAAIAMYETTCRAKETLDEKKLYFSGHERQQILNKWAEKQYPFLKG